MALLIKSALAYRNFYGSDGSDQMETMVLAGVVCGAVSDRHQLDIAATLVMSRS